ncbi:MAG TPA: hypothetical protein VGB18_04675, partial [Candidatus Thermoplasmatota archaeon]
MRGATLGLLLLGSLLSGCLDGTDGNEPPAETEDRQWYDLLPWEELGAAVYNEEHDHRDRGLHREVARGLTVLNTSALSDNGLSLGEYTEADHEHGLIAVAVVTGAGSTMRIVFLREDDLPAINVVGSIDEPNSYGDVKFDPQQKLVYIPYPGDKAFSIWDVSNIGSPRRVGEAQGPGCHMLHALPIDGVSHVFCAGLGGSIVYRIEDNPQGGIQAVPVAVAAPQSDPEVVRYATYYEDLSPLGPALITTPHDQTAQPDPITGDPLLVTAHELQGIRVFDVSIPAAPREISYWRGEDMNDADLERVHTVGIAEVNGKRLGFGA